MGGARGAEWALPSRSLWPQGEHGVSTGPVPWPAGWGGGITWHPVCERSQRAPSRGLSGAQLKCSPIRGGIPYPTLPSWASVSPDGSRLAPQRALVHVTRRPDHLGRGDSLLPALDLFRA